MLTKTLLVVAVAGGVETMESDHKPIQGALLRAPASSGVRFQTLWALLPSWDDKAMCV